MESDWFLIKQFVSEHPLLTLLIFLHLIWTSK